MKRIKFVNMVAKLLGLKGEYKRERVVLGITIGDDYWIPSMDELEKVRRSFEFADIDPAGAVIASRKI